MSFTINRASLSLAVSTALLVSACGESTSSQNGPGFGTAATITPDTTFNQTALIENLTDNVITPVFEQFNTVSAAQVQFVNSYCETETSAAESTATGEQVTVTRNSAKDAWRNTMNIWQQAELMQIGPLADNNGLLRDKIYSWPVVNTCSVDFEVVNFRIGEVNGQPYNIANRTASRRGLAALEYLLFNEELNHSCTTSTQPENWDNQTDEYRKVARCEFAVEVAQDINNNAQELINLWAGEEGFANTLKAAGTEGNQFTTELEAINHISDALFYLDSETKDDKLATPLGLLINPCGSQVCPEVVESVYANNSIDNIENNLLAFQKLFTGELGLGFLEYLIDVGDEITADTMSSDVEQAIEGVQAYQNTLAATLVNNEEQVVQTHTEIKNITDKLKTDFITSLSLELPVTSAGDND